MRVCVSAHFLDINYFKIIIIMDFAFLVEKIYRWTDHLHIVLVYVASCAKHLCFGAIAV